MPTVVDLVFVSSEQARGNSAVGRWRSHGDSALPSESFTAPALSLLFRTMAAVSPSSRALARIVTALPTSDGAGVNLFRSLGTPAFPIADPFLMLDEFRSDEPSDYLAGFPNHPHRGFETVTIMLAGEMEHLDDQGNRGRLSAGAVQWMTAGRGIIHSEMPKQRDGLMWGFQLWINLAAQDKMCAPRYRDLEPDQIPHVDLEHGGMARVIAGEVGGIRGPIVGGRTDPLILDVHLPPQGALSLPIASGYQTLLYVYQGAFTVADAPKDVRARQLAVLHDEGSDLRGSATSEDTRLLVLAAKPLREPVARSGPFVMNTREELERAYADFRSGRFSTATP